MPLWSAERREQIVDAEIHSRLGFSTPANPAGNETVSVWHLRTAAPVGGNAPVVDYRPLVRVSRPPENVFIRQLDLVANYADLRADRQTEILAQLDGANAFLSSIVYLHPERTKWTLEVLSAVFRTAQFVEMRLKHALACRRPNEFSPQIQPMILTP